MTNLTKKIVAVVLLFLATAYLLAPIDIIPDVISVFGQIDDAIVAVLSIINAVNSFKPQRAES